MAWRVAGQVRRARSAPLIASGSEDERAERRERARQLADLIDGQSVVTYGHVGTRIRGRQLPPDTFAIAPDEFLSLTDSGMNIRYRKGEGVTIERLEGFDAEAQELYLRGSVYAAIASMHGMLPIHASAIAARSGAVAFTGPSGAGKSTLIAALGARGHPMYCDDTLVLDLAGSGPMIALPGHKRLKLSDSALAMTGAAAGEPVWRGSPKRYAEPPAGAWSDPLPLGSLVFLAYGHDFAFERITGAQCFALLDDDHYTSVLFAGGSGLDRAGRFALRARLAGSVSMARFVRPRDPSRFDAGVEFLAGAMRSEGWIE